MNVNLSLYSSWDRNYITEEKRKELSDVADELLKMFTSLIVYLEGTELKGIKFKVREKKVEFIEFGGARSSAFGV